jgi:hypothetical protein
LLVGKHLERLCTSVDTSSRLLIHLLYQCRASPSLPAAATMIDFQVFPGDIKAPTALLQRHFGWGQFNDIGMAEISYRITVCFPFLA